MKKLVVIIACLCTAACGSITRTHVHVKGEGLNAAEQDMNQVDYTPPFAKKADTVGKMETHKTADGNYDVVTGQNAKGIDNTAQVQAMQVFMTSMMKAFTEAITAMVGLKTAQTQATAEVAGAALGPHPAAAAMIDAAKKKAVGTVLNSTPEPAPAGSGGG